MIMVLMEMPKADFGKRAENIINYGVHMLLKNKRFLYGILFFGMLYFCFMGCGGVYYPWASIGLGVNVYADDACTEPLGGIVCTLRNDEISSDILATSVSDASLNGAANFSIQEGGETESSSVYIGSDIDAELEKETDGTSTFYIVVNDPETSGYNKNYTTEIQKCNTPDIYNDKAYVILSTKE